MTHPDTPFLVHGICDGRCEPLLRQLGAQNPASSAELVRTEQLIAVVSPLPRETSPQASFEDPDQVMRWAIDHNTVLARIAGKTDVVPLRLGTVMSSRASVEKLLTERFAEFDEALSRLAGTIEMGVVIERAARGATPTLRASEEGLSSASTGRDYLRQRAAVKSRLKNFERRRHTALNDLAVALDQVCAEIRSLPVAKATGVTAEPERLASWALLVEREAQVDVVELVQVAQATLEAVELSATVNGPWPVYTFVASEGRAA